MPTIVEVDGAELEFPDSMSEDQIKAVLKEQYQQPDSLTQ
jgi:hypothetical protein